MENGNQNFSGFTQIFNSSPNPMKNQYLHMEEACQFKNWVENMETPLKNEVEILRYCQTMKEQSKLDEIPSLFDAEDEAEKIRSGYYIDINESLNIFKHFHGEANPFIKFHEDALAYLKELQNASPSVVQEMQQLWPSNSENDNFLDEIEVEPNSDISLLNVSGFENDDSEKLVENEETVKKSEKQKKRKFRFPIVERNFIWKTSKRQKTTKMAPKSSKKSNRSSKTKSSKKTVKIPEELLHNLPLPAETPTKVTFTPPEFQVLEDEKYLEYLETQFIRAVFEDNGRTIFPILTNYNFKGIKYDLEDELKNNEIIKNEIFSRASIWRKF